MLAVSSEKKAHAGMNVESIWSESHLGGAACLTKSLQLMHLWEKSSKKLEREGEDYKQK